jgi:hypothetical protein
LPDATITIEKVWKGEPQDGQYGTFHKYDVQFVGGGKARYVTFKDELGEKATANQGRKVLVTFEEPKEEGHNPKLTAISDPLDESVAAAPTSNGARQTKQPEAPETQASIAASVALKEANAYVTKNPMEAPELFSLADQMFDWLMSKSQAAAPEKGAQSLPGASEQPATEGQIKEIAELLVVLEKQTPASPDPTWTWTSEAQKYCSANFDKNSLVTLTKAEANQLRGHLEDRIASIQAEKGIPF